MEAVLKLAKTYRVTPGLAERLQLAEELFALIEPELRLFVFTSLRPPAAEDVLQESLSALATGLDKFAGNTTGEFWAWCHRICRNKLADHFRRQGRERVEPLPDEDLWALVEASTRNEPLSAGDRHDLEHALQLLAASQPGCRDYLWRHFVLGLDYADIAAAEALSYDSVRMRISRCLDEAQSLVA